MLRVGGHLCVPEGKEGHGSTCETFIRQNHPRISARRRCCWVGSGWGPGACISTQGPGEATEAPALGKGTWPLCVEAKIYRGKRRCSPAPTPTASQDYCSCLFRPQVAKEALEKGRGPDRHPSPRPSWALSSLLGTGWFLHF